MSHVEHTQRVHKLVYETHLLRFISLDVPTRQHHVKCSGETQLHSTHTNTYNMGIADIVS